MKKILLVDDEAHITEILKYFLISSGYQVDIARNGLEALEKVTAAMPDAIVTDIQMPKLTGLEFCQRLRSEFPDENSLVIVMTSRTERDFRQQAGEMENMQFVEKPLSPKALVAMLTEYFSAVVEA